MNAPIVLFVYNRLNHLKLCLEALKRNALAGDSNLIIYSDGPKNEADAESIAEVRKFISELDGFRKVEVITREVNRGLSNSVIQGVTEAVNKYGRVIVLEDDLLPSKYFLKYMNDALNKYESDENVISIHGYIYPVKNKLSSPFFLRGADCWGWATWKRGWDLLETNGQELLNRVRDQGEEYRFNFYNSYPYTTMLQDQIAGRNNSWAILWYASAFVKRKLTLYPAQSMIHNIGNDNSGTHSKATTRYEVAVNEAEVRFDGIQIPVNDNIQAVRAIADYFVRSHSRVGFLRRLINKLFKVK